MKLLVTVAALSCVCFAMGLPTMTQNPCGCPIPHGLDCQNKAHMVSFEATGPTAADKLKSTWDSIASNTHSRGYMNPALTLLHAANKTYLESMQVTSIVATSIIVHAYP